MNQTFKTEVTQDLRFFGREMKVLTGLMEDKQNNSEQQETGSITATTIITTTENSKHKYKNIKNKYIYNKNNNDNNIKNVPQKINNNKNIEFKKKIKDFKTNNKFNKRNKFKSLIKQNNFSIFFWNIRGIKANDFNHPKQQFLKNIGCDIIVLNEQWVNYSLKGYTSIINQDKFTKVSKINTSMFIKDGTNFTQLYKDQVNNTIFLSLEDDNLFVIGTYLRPDDKLDNEIQVAEIYNKINDIKENHPNSKIIMVGDLNRSDPIEKRYIQKLLNEHDYKDFSHFNNKLEKNSQSKLSKIYYYNTKIKSHVCKELMNTLSDHAGILIQLPDEGLKFAPS